MTVLSPKALRFVALAIDEVDDRDARAVWDALDKSKDIPPAAADMALRALLQYEDRLRSALACCDIDEERAADLSNDIGTVRAIEHVLEQERARQTA